MINPFVTSTKNLFIACPVFARTEEIYAIRSIGGMYVVIRADKFADLPEPISAGIQFGSKRLAKARSWIPKGFRRVPRKANDPGDLVEVWVS